MTLKTATLCALIGLILNFLFGLCSFTLQKTLDFSDPSSIQIINFLWLIQMILFNGSLILFLAVLYSKQKGTQVQ